MGDRSSDSLSDMRSTLLCALACALVCFSVATISEELVTNDNPETQMLLSEAEHKAAVKASYQTNVKTIYFHLEEIIRKILAHKTKWTNKYNGDLAKIAKEVLNHKTIAKNKEKKYTAAKGKAEAAKALA